MNNKKNKDDQEQITDVKGTIIGFVATEPGEKTQEQEIQDFKLKKRTEEQLLLLSEEEQKKKRKEQEEEEEWLKKAKKDLLDSLTVRIPAIIKKFDDMNKKGRVVEKVQSKTHEIREKETENQKIQNQDEKERE